MKEPLVSVVIPTRNRPTMVVRAVQSALNQSWKHLEVVVVVDGPDEETVSILRGIGEPRLNVVALEISVGGAEARNIGARHARGEWIALLDDDDEYREEKIERQISHTTPETVLVSCKVIVRGNAADQIKPDRFPENNERLGEYLFCRNTLRQRNFLQTSSFLVRRDALLSIPFTAGLRRHQDWDWLLMLSSKSGFQLLCIDEALVVYHTGTDLSVSKSGTWLDSLSWGMQQLRIGQLTPRAYSYFIATQCVTRINERGVARLVPPLRLAWEFIVNGRPTLQAAALFAGFYLRGPRVL